MYCAVQRHLVGSGAARSVGGFRGYSREGVARSVAGLNKYSREGVAVSPGVTLWCTMLLCYVVAVFSCFVSLSFFFLASLP